MPDPFEHLFIVQVKTGSLRFVTCDRLLPLYGEAAVEVFVR